jgi:hypothetical protein
VKSLRSSTAIRTPARTLVHMILAPATVLPPALAGSPSVAGARQPTMPLASALQDALSRLTRILLLVAVALCLGAPAAGAVPAKKLDNNLAVLWTTVLQTPTDENPIGTDGCFRLGGILAPFGGPSTGAGPCTVKPGTKVFVAASSVECSTLEPPPFFGANEDELRNCARDQDVDVAPTVTVDGKSVPVSEVETPLLHITLPENNILGRPAAQGLVGQSVAHGWVALLHPLTPGEHTIVGEGAVVVPPGTGAFRTTIVVQPGFKP